ncbi:MULTISPECIES: MarR family winged helix-turn-helix transcriptional regulator [Roseobacteraceae]|uniref:DNA-binding transcriptional repressor MarR n=1 Tax=Pseudosulfitobacter pseudonitzschiae TaxID=1402135 RepID=A0A221K2C7_9RHOB|nr:MULTISPECIES: MarR family transcriptional regulator [Roseobacteraceae]ASM73033.1 DNA-binding transcriptional repressor MarR [Pseudosulfitobacter pseudonitzschiae]
MKDNAQPPSQFDMRQYLTYRLAKLQNALNAQAAQMLSAHSNLTLTEWRVLFILRTMSTATMSMIVQESRLDKAQISRAVKALVEKGYVATVQDENDQRRQLLSATPEGRELKDRLLPVMMRRQQALTDGLQKDEVETFFRVLQQLEEVALRREF